MVKYIMLCIFLFATNMYTMNSLSKMGEQAVKKVDYDTVQDASYILDVTAPCSACICGFSTYFATVICLQASIVTIPAVCCCAICGSACTGKTAVLVSKKLNMINHRVNR